MAFIDKLLEGGELPYGMTVEQPKAHEEINSLILDDDLENMLNDLVMGVTGGGGAGKGVSKLILAMKGKIKGGKMIPSQPFRYGSVIGGPNPSKLDILLNKLKDNPNIGGNINRVMLENVKKYKPKK